MGPRAAASCWIVETSRPNAAWTRRKRPFLSAGASNQAPVDILHTESPRRCSGSPGGLPARETAATWPLSRSDGKRPFWRRSPRATGHFFLTSRQGRLVSRPEARPGARGPQGGLWRDQRACYGGSSGPLRARPRRPAPNTQAHEAPNNSNSTTRPQPARPGKLRHEKPWSPQQLGREEHACLKPRSVWLGQGSATCPGPCRGRGDSSEPGFSSCTCGVTTM
jgi:hypothetical protein